MEDNYTINNNGQIMKNGVVVVMEENDPTYIAYVQFLESGGTVTQLDEPVIVEEFTGPRSAKKN
jgi:hypothetical protein